MHSFPGESGLRDFSSWLRSARASPSQIAPRNELERKLLRSKRGISLKATFPDPAVDDAYLHPSVDDDDEPFTFALPDLAGLRQ